MNEYRFPKLWDKEWLKKAYSTMSPKKIASIIGCERSTVKNALIRLGIQRRTKSEARRLLFGEDGFTIENRGVYEGSMLGDAHIQHGGNNGSLYPRFTKGNKNLDHVEYVAAKLFKANHSERIFAASTLLNGKVFPKFEMRSFVNPLLTAEHKRWYYRGEDEWVKRVPADIEMSTECILHWFMDDGYSYYPEPASKHSIIGFSSMSFTRDENLLLIGLMNEKFAIDARLRKCSSGTGWFISIPSTKAGLFYEVIGACPVPSMEFKWKTFSVDHLYRLKDREWLHSQYVVADRSAKDISREIDCSLYSVSHWLDRHLIPRKPVRISSVRHPLLVDVQKMKSLYLDDGLTAAEIGKMIGCNKNLVRDWLIRHSIPMRPSCARRR